MIQRVAGISEPTVSDLRPGELFLSELKFQTYRLHP